MVAALIAARGGSVRLPRKNVRPFCGIPLVAWSIVAAKCSHLIDEVFVTTDDDEIRGITRQYGANVIDDPPRVEGQSALPAMVNGMRKIVAVCHPEIVLSILPTNPLHKPDDFDKGIRLFREIGCDCLSPMRPLRETVLQEVIGQNRCKGVVFDKGFGYVDQATFWTVSSPNWYLWSAAQYTSIKDKEIDKAAKEHPGEARYYMATELWQFCDCDTLEDFELGELIMEHFILKGRGVKVYEDYAENKTALEQLAAMYAGNLNQQ